MKYPKSDAMTQLADPTLPVSSRKKARIWKAQLKLIWKLLSSRCCQFYGRPNSTLINPFWGFLSSSLLTVMELGWKSISVTMSPYLWWHPWILKMTKKFAVSMSNTTTKQNQFYEHRDHFNAIFVLHFSWIAIVLLSLRHFRRLSFSKANLLLRRGIKSQTRNFS